VVELMGKELQWTPERCAWEREHCDKYLQHFGGPIPLEDEEKEEKEREEKEEDDTPNEDRARVATDFDLGRLFDAYDTSGSGRISAAELMQVSTGLGYVLTEEQVQDCVTACDKDGDGLVSKAEFIEWWNSDSTNPHLQRLKHAQATFTNIEGSGSLFG
jgi:hypothetical protein